jgi:hypothetical protein
VNRWAIIWIGTGLFIVWFLPNSQDWLLNGETITKRFAKLSRLLIWKPNLLWGLCFAGLFLAVTLRMSKTNEFLYFQF